jgi:hypothetical protein
MTVAKDLGWILTFTADASAVSQISMATEGGSGTQVRDVSVEVGNLDEIYERARAGGYPIEYCPVTEPWGAPLLYTRPVRPLAQHADAYLIAASSRVHRTPAARIQPADRFACSQNGR